MSRTLLSVQRRIERPRLPLYDVAWAKFRAAAVADGAKAWRFRSSADDELFLEFLEFAGEDPRGGEDLRQSMKDLAALADGDVEEWVDANLNEKVEQ